MAYPQQTDFQRGDEVRRLRPTPVDLGTLTAQRPSPVRRVSQAVGVAFIVLGILGYGITALGANQAGIHNFLHILVGILCMTAARMPSSRTVRAFAVSSGSLMLALGLIGFMLGAVNNIWALIPGAVEFGTHDHWEHILAGLALLGSGLIGRLSFRQSATLKTPI